MIAIKNGENSELILFFLNEEGDDEISRFFEYHLSKGHRDDALDIQRQALRGFKEI